MRHEDAFFGDTIGKHTHVFFLVVAFYMLCVDVCPFVYIHIVLKYNLYFVLVIFIIYIQNIL